MASDFNNGRSAFNVTYFNEQVFANNVDWYGISFEGQEDTAKKFAVQDSTDIIFTKNKEIVPENDIASDFLFYEMQRGLRDYTITDHPRYTFTFTREDIPNVHIQGVWFDGAHYKVSLSTRIGSASSLNAQYDFSNQDLAVDVQTDKASYAPGENVTLSLKVTDKNNSPIRDASVNVSLVDEAVFAIMDNPADPLASVYRDVSSGELSTYSSHKSAELSSGAEGGGCFLAGTQILLADGTQKSIEDIVAGDMIATFAAQNDTNMVSSPVKEVFTHTVTGYLKINNSLLVTPVHKILINGQWDAIGNARIGDVLTDESGNPVVITQIEYIPQTVTVYNFHVDTYHTYMANGIYVHNEKGGVRTTFKDTALFNTVTTDNNGVGQVTFTLPDNITAWRVTAQTITDSLQAGVTTKKVSASLPVFVQNNLSRSYLNRDKPSVKIRAFGDELTKGDAVKFTVSSTDLGLDSFVTDGKAFESTYVKFADLPVGSHDIGFSVSAGKYADSMIQNMLVTKSRLSQKTQWFGQLQPGMQIEGSTDGITTITFADENQGRVYADILSLGQASQDRLDAKVGRYVSSLLAHTYFGDEMYLTDEDTDFTQYQSAEGVSLLPYSSTDFELSAKVLAVAPEKFDRTQFQGIFYGLLDDQNATQGQVALSLYALAYMGEPVLLPAQHFAEIDGLSAKEQLYIALALEKLGDGERARRIYASVLDQYGEQADALIRVSINDDIDDTLELTALAAILGASFSDEYHTLLWNYVEKYHTEKMLIDLEKAMYLQNLLPELIPGDVSFKITVGDKTIEETLSKGQTYTVQLNREQVAQLQVLETKGTVGVVSQFDVPVEDTRNGVSPLISLKREYRVNGVITNTFSENDIVEVRLYPNVTNDLVKGMYQVTDILPSGMRSITSLVHRQMDFTCYNYPYTSDNQTNKFMIYLDTKKQDACNKGYFSYSARVTSPGTYIAEPALLQSFDTPSIKNFSNEATVEIERY